MVKRVERRREVEKRNGKESGEKLRGREKKW